MQQAPKDVIEHKLCYRAHSLPSLMLLIFKLIVLQYSYYEKKIKNHEIKFKTSLFLRLLSYLDSPDDSESLFIVSVSSATVSRPL